MAQILVKKEDNPDLLSEGLLQKFGQGGTLGWRDELSARLSQGMSAALDPNYGKYATGDEVYQQELARQRGQEAAYQEAHPVASFGAELAGGVALGGGSLAGATRLGMKGLPAAMGLGIGEGGVYGAGAANEGDRLAGAATGALFGAVAGPIGYGLGRMAARVKNQLTDAAGRANTLQAGRRLGYEYTPAQRTDLQELKIREAGMMGDPASARNFLNTQNTNQITSNRLASRQIGEDATALTEDVIDSAALRLEREFGNLDNLQAINIGNRQLTELADLEQSYKAAWGSTNMKLLDDAIDELTDLAATGKPLPAERYQYLHSQLGKSLQRYRKDPQKLEVVGGLRDVLNNAVEDSLGPQSLGRWQEARRQWGNLQTLMKPGVIRDGNLSERSLYNVVRRDNPLNMMRGKSRQPELEAIAKMGGLTKDLLPSSGTAERLAAQRNMRTLIPDLISNQKTKAYLARPELFIQAPGEGAGTSLIPGLLGARENLKSD